MKRFLNRSIKKTIVLVSAVVLGAFVFTACGGKEESDNEVTRIIVGSGNMYNPYCYVDEEGNAVGYEYDVLKAIDELLPQYEFEYQTMAFDQLLLSLDSGKIDLAAHQYEYTDERAEKYLI
ncbi:MAG: transporter substrate-binding domain-containing protein [Lachnospiraceae bacterium]|nr:transporter substrate-binding domain-containing protein [Lachnospiraceae bacterium]